LGDGLFILILCLFFFFFISKRQGLYMGTSAALGGMLVQVLKQVVFSDYLRPVAYFQQQGLEPLRLVPDVSVNHYFSFPSGHTMVAFAVAFSMALFYKKRWVDQLAFILALLIGYSRVYLSQHFLIDVWMGSMIGILVALIAYPWYYPKSFKPGKFDAPLIRIR
jgi:membrane-associated phospholipid phosphatase